MVTGASGHIGYHICKLLISKGYKVKAFIRPSSFREHLLKLPLEINYGDILSLDSLKKAMKNVEAIFHTAAVYKLSQEKKDDSIIKIAVEGTKNLYQAAFESRVKKIIHTSSVETVGLSYDKNILLNESDFTKKAFYAYSIAKIKSEIITLELARRFNLYTVICNPSTVIGRDDYKPTPSNKMLLNYAKYNLFYVESGQSLVDVQDVAQGHISALLKGRNLERYILSGDNMEIKDVIVLISKR
ncbi:MAG: NAD-dependent epimerase/dehydratase family protein [Candidatus Omnitrophica bacterium]|nr:NAD-dependent epimerase/dehydratase family protein [Candidatus Omnitrophota bacterium]MBU1523626.1 NAD-dependent epimerase/dehydratase family protein [Candidatus Omnitrophota bacterium]